MTRVTPTSRPGAVPNAAVPHADAPTGALGTVRRRCPEARTTTDTVGRLLDLLARDYGLDA